MLRFSAVQRRRRLVSRHRLSPATAAADVGEAVDSVLVLHATDPATVYLSVLARAPGATVDDVARAMYDDRTLVRMLAMRRTLFVVPRSLVPVVHAGASVEVAKRQRARLLKELATIPTDPPLEGDLEKWLADVEASTERALARRGSASASELSADEPRLRTAQLPTTDKSYDVRRNLTTRILTLMACEGRIVRARTRGAWTSRAHTWELGASWWPDGIDGLAPEEARAALAERWLRVFGPAPVSDLQWWTGWALGVTKAALTGLDVVACDLDGVEGVVLADDAEPEPAAESGSGGPAATLLPALDPTPMGWQQRDWFLGEHRARLFDTYGNIGPTVWWDGRVVGGWAVRADGEVVWRMLEDVGAEASAAVEQAAADIHDRIGGAVVVPSFRTPLERELSA